MGAFLALMTQDQLFRSLRLEHNFLSVFYLHAHLFVQVSVRNRAVSIQAFAGSFSCVR